jgi:outer membrane protein OmpA-like peptidoglycan-associated protein
MKRTALIAATALLLSMNTALAQGAQDAAYDKRQGFVADSQGDCVRTKWTNSEDPCNPPAPPPPVVQAPPPAPVMPTVSLEQRTIYFDFDKAELTSEAQYKLDALSNIINESTAIADVRIHGFTDQFGTSDYNKVLADKRAAAVKNYLDSRSRLSSTIGDIKGIGKSAPEAGCEGMKKRDEKISCMAKERRVEIEFKAQR